MPLARQIVYCVLLISYFKINQYVKLAHQIHLESIIYCFSVHAYHIIRNLNTKQQRAIVVIGLVFIVVYLVVPLVQHSLIDIWIILIQKMLLVAAIQNSYKLIARNASVLKITIRNFKNVYLAHCNAIYAKILLETLIA